MRPMNVPGRRRRRARAMTMLCVPAALAALASAAAACDVCAVYTATEVGERRTGFRLGVAEQVTNFTTLQRDGREVPNPGNEWLTSSITQVVLGYTFGPRVGVQLNLPFITRQFHRHEGDRLAHGDETGFGDLSLLAHVLAASHVTERSVFRFSVLGGLKLPSGSTGRLKEELSEGPATPAALGTRTAFAQHAAGGSGGGSADVHAHVSGIHGHDLALGSGSVDGIFGGQLFWSWQRFFFTATGQYALRTEGDIGYRYADELSWTGGPGVFALLEHDHTLGLQAVVSGESKGKDSLRGVPADDTGVTALYAGPGVLFTWGSSLSADLTADLPVLQHNTALQIVPDYRLRGGLTWRF